MTRRQLLMAPVAGALYAADRPVIVPVQQIIDSRANLSPRQLQRFSDIWAEATRDLRRCGIELPWTRKASEIRRSPSGAPIFTGLLPHVINMAVTGSIPTLWDSGRGLSGVTTRYEGFHLCVVALNHAHGHQIPFFSTNTCVHELLHALLQDIYENRPSGLTGETRELRVDAYATRLWLLHDGAAIRSAAELYMRRLRASR
jgi:hypothetical protein